VREYREEMASRSELVKLTSVQLQYLQRLMRSEGWPVGLAFSDSALVGSVEAVEALRDRLTEILAERGFAEDYSPNAEGKLLEDLIDTLSC
jgi:hypothetical protein